MKEFSTQYIESARQNDERYAGTHELEYKRILAVASVTQCIFRLLFNLLSFLDPGLYFIIAQYYEQGENIMEISF